MCIIAVKPAGVKLPSDYTLRNMWEGNPDGAGFMYTDGNGHVLIRKGFMKWKSFKRNLDSLAEQVDLTATPLIMHFRITTHGGTRPENTHPFPVTDHVETLKKTTVRTTLGMAHNGIIHSVTPRKDLSDTMEYIASQVAPLRRALPNFLENKNALLLVKNAIGSGSKLAFLSGSGAVYTVGNFINEDGMLYSNYSFRGYYYSHRHIDWSKYDSYGNSYGGSYYSLGSDSFSYDDWRDRNSSYGSSSLVSKSEEDKPDTTQESWDDNMEDRLLMFLDDDMYVRTKNGDIFSGDGYLMDKGFRVYEWDDSVGCAIELQGASAYNATTSVQVRFDEDNSLDFPVLCGDKVTA